MAQHFVAERPERVLSLGLLNSGISPRNLQRVNDYRHADDPAPTEIIPRFLEMADDWPANPQRMVDWFLPSQSGNESVIRWIGRLQRLSCSPRDFRRHSRASSNSTPVMRRSASRCARRSVTRRATR